MRTTARLLRIGLITGMFATLTVAGVSTAQAGAVAPAANLGCTAIAPHAKAPRPDAAALGEYISTMHHQGASQVTIDAGLSACYGLVRETGTGTARPAETNLNDVNLPAPTVYWSSSYNDNLVTGNWAWNNFTGMTDGNHQDGYALGASNPIHIVNQWAGWYNNSYGTSGSTSTSDGGTNAGRGFEFNNYFQSGLSWEGGTAGNGYATLVFDRAGYGCGNVYFTPKYSHGWNSSTLSSFSIGISNSGPSITANYTNQSNSWQGYGADSTNYNIC